MTGELGAVLTYGVLTVLWGVILALLLRHYAVAREDGLIRALLAVLALDAGRTFIESLYFGLVWGERYGVLTESLRALSSPALIAAVKLMNVAVAVVVLGWLIRRWLPRQLAERDAQRERDAQLQARLEASLATAKENEERFRLAAAASRDALWDWDLRTDLVFTTPRFAEMLGHDPATWAPTLEPFLRALHPEDSARVNEHTQAFIRGEVPDNEVRFRMIHKDGSVLQVASNSLLVRDAGGKPVRLVGITRDLTKEVKAEEARVAAQKLEGLGVLAGGVAHDFNNLLTVVSASLTLAGRSSTNPGQAQEALNTAALAVQRAATLTRQLSAYAGRTQLTKRPVDVSALVREMRELLEVSATRRVRLELALGDGLPGVLGDEGQLQQVVMNLVTNAAEAIGEAEGVVTLRTSVEEAGGAKVVRLRVTDTGAGMTPEVQARLFDPFFSTKGIGRGLGLAAIDGILRGHQGAVAVESRPGAGTTFTVTLPALPTPAAAREKPDAQPGSLTARVLLVDDEPLLRRSASRLLKLLGCTVTEACDGAEAVQAVTQAPAGFDVVVMDVTMPVLDGIDAARQLAQLAPRLPVVLSSGYSHDPRAGELPEGVRTLAKPYRVEELEALLRDVTTAQG